MDNRGVVRSHLNGHVVSWQVSGMAFGNDVFCQEVTQFWFDSGHYEPVKIYGTTADNGEIVAIAIPEVCGNPTSLELIGAERLIPPQQAPPPEKEPKIGRAAEACAGEYYACTLWFNCINYQK